MRSTVQVRPLSEADYPQWRSLWDGYNAFYGRSGPTSLPEPMTTLTWERFFDEREPMHALVADASGQLLGLTHYLYHRSTTQERLICYLQDLYTREDVRGQGVGRALIEGVYASASAVGSRRVYWQTHETNQQAMQLYNQVAERSGFLVYRKEITG